MVVNRLRLLCAAVAVATVVACGGGGGSKGQGSVSGNVMDIQGNPVRNARIFPTADPNTFTVTNSAGSFTLMDVNEGDAKIAASILIDGIEYYGENVIRVFANEPSKSMDIVMGRRDRMARLNGVVSDRFGSQVEGARVFANAGLLGSSIAVTDRDGEFTLFLHPDLNYDVVAGALGFDSDSDAIRLTASQTVTRNYILSNPSDVAFSPPANFEAVAWTSPAEATRSPRAANAYEAIKRAVKPRHAKAAPKTPTRRPLNTINGNWIEVDLYWDPITHISLLGYGIYRGTSQTGNLTGIEFLRDPLAGFFADADPSLRQNVIYYYEATALNVNFPDTQNSESDFSDRWGVRPLGDCILRAHSAGTPVRFNWNATPGAEKYTVYVFDLYPDLGVEAFWPTNATELTAATTTSTSLNYAGPALGPGTYYYIVLAQDTRDGNQANSISRIGSFTLD